MKLPFPSAYWQEFAAYLGCQPAFVEKNLRHEYRHIVISKDFSPHSVLDDYATIYGRSDFEYIAADRASGAYSGQAKVKVVA